MQEKKGVSSSYSKDKMWREVGENGIRTHGTNHFVQQLSKLALSTSQPPLPFWVWQGLNLRPSG